MAAPPGAPPDDPLAPVPQQQQAPGAAPANGNNPGTNPAQPAAQPPPALPPGQANALPQQSNAVPTPAAQAACPQNAPVGPANAQQQLPNAMPTQANASPCGANALPGPQALPPTIQVPAQPGTLPNAASVLQNGGTPPAVPNAILGIGSVQAAPTGPILPLPESTVVYYFSNTAAYDDNLYRLSSGEAAPVIGTSKTSRTDFVDTASLGVDGLWYFARQKVAVDAHIDDNRFVNNTALNNWSGTALVQDDFNVGNRFSGRAGATFSQLEPGFTNNRFFGRDLLDTDVLFGEGRFALTPHWYLRADGQHAETTHTETSEKSNDFSGNSYGVGIEYQATGEVLPVPGPDYTTTAQDLLLANQTIVGLDYGRSTGTFTHQTLVDTETFNRDFKDDDVSLRIASPIAPKTVLHASGGYLKRTYDPSTLTLVSHDFHGAVWDASIEWALTEKTSLTIEAWRKLTGYIEAQANYFISNQRSITGEWRPTEKIILDLQYAFDHQLYTGNADAVGIIGTAYPVFPRRDVIHSAQARMTYAFNDHFQLTGTWNSDKRASNEPELSFDDTRESLVFRLQF